MAARPLDSCGEDERPLNELVILQLGVAVDHRNGRCNVSLCKGISGHWNQERRRFLRGTADLVSRIRVPSFDGEDPRG